MNVEKYVDIGVATAIFAGSLIAFLFHNDDVTKGLVTASFAAVLTLLNVNRNK